MSYLPGIEANKDLPALINDLDENTIIDDLFEEELELSSQPVSWEEISQ